MDILLTAITSAISVLKMALPSIFIGLFLANLFSAYRFSAKADKLLLNIERVTGLPNSVLLVLFLSIFDRTAGMAALEAARRKDGLSSLQVVAVNLTAKAPSTAQFFVFSFIPLVVSLFPYTTALGFLLGYFLAFVTISIIGLMLLNIKPYRSQSANRTAETAAQDCGSWLQRAMSAFRQALRPFIRIALWMLTMSVLVMLAINSGVLSILSDTIAAREGLFDANAIALVGVGLISMVGGVAAVGAAWQEGLLARESIVPLLFLMSIVHNVYDLFSSSLPRTIAVYGRELGIKTGLIGFVVTQTVMIAFFLLASQGLFG